jgi:phosphopantothenoylcysteine decarboxylase/phosphopantothenate--cysteine ligase
MGKKEIVLGVTGSIAIYKSLDLINLLKARGFNITVIMTEEAQELIRPLTFQTISGNQVYTDMFTLSKDFDLAHISLADKADLILLCPATANIIGKLANGICDDLLTCTVVSSPAPVIICPAMNDKMYRNPAVQKNIATLKTHGYKFVGPVKGKLACGRVGIGHLAPPEEIVQVIVHELK